MKVSVLIVFVIGTFLRTCFGEWCLNEPHIDEPCPRLDPSCVRTFFAQHSRCKPVDEPPLDYYPIEGLPLPFPHSNATWSWNDAHATGLNDGQIRKFYINRNTNNLLMEVVFREVTTSTPSGTLRYYIKGKEPLELMDHFGVTYRDMSQTLIVPVDPVSGIRWSERDIYTYVGDSFLPLVYGSGLYNSDPELLASFQIMCVGEKALTVRVASFDFGPRYFSQYFDNNICKF